jgi:hypothetical protein
LQEGLDHLAEVHQFNWRINENAFRALDLKDVASFLIADPKPVRPMRCVRLETILREMLAHVSPEADLVIRGDHIEITTRSALRREFYPNRRSTEPLPPLLVLSYKETPLSKALDELPDLGEWSVVLDQDAVKEAAKKPISATLTNVPLDTAVRVMADLAGLKAVTVERVVYVTTREKADSLRREELERHPELRARPRGPGGKGR